MFIAKWIDCRVATAIDDGQAAHRLLIGTADRCRKNAEPAMMVVKSCPDLLHAAIADGDWLSEPFGVCICGLLIGRQRLSKEGEEAKSHFDRCRRLEGCLQLGRDVAARFGEQFGQSGRRLFASLEIVVVEL